MTEILAIATIKKLTKKYPDRVWFNRADFVDEIGLGRDEKINETLRRLTKKNLLSCTRFKKRGSNRIVYYWSIL